MMRRVWTRWMGRREPSARAAKRDRGRSRPVLEALEWRALLTTPGVDYALSGQQWADPSRVTYSIVPDGTFWDRGTNRLNAAFNARFGAGVWQREVARALATWQAAARINFVLVTDSGQGFDSLGREQGDPRFGDIRFGGHAFANTTTTLARTYSPPPNGTTAAGDVEVNTAMPFAIGSDYDFYSVMLHETGHSLGLEHPLDPAEVLYAQYGGVRAGLSAGDIAGIRAIYGARQPDAYRSQGLGASTARPIDVSGLLNGSGDAALGGLSLTTIGDTTYFSVAAPAGASGAFRVTAAASGSSLLSPKISVFDTGGRLLDSGADPAAWCNDVTASLSAVNPGQRFLIAVTGATSDVFAVGAYALLVDFDSAPAPAVRPTPSTAGPTNPGATPVTQAFAPDRFEGNDSIGTPTNLGTVSRRTVSGLNLHSAADVDVFLVRASRPGLFVVTAKGTFVTVFDAAGNVVASGYDQVGAAVAAGRSPVYVQLSVPSGVAVGRYSLGVTYRAQVASRLKARPGVARRQVAQAHAVKAAEYAAPQTHPAGPAAISRVVRR